MLYLENVLDKRILLLHYDEVLADLICRRKTLRSSNRAFQKRLRSNKQEYIIETKKFLTAKDDILL